MYALVDGCTYFILFFIDYVSSVDLFFSRVHWSVQGHAKRV